MGQNRLPRPCWKITNSRIPASVSDVIDIILENRNIDPLTFYGGLEDLSGHLMIRGMSEGADLLAKHMANGSKIVVIADYDCDGITSAAQIALFLQETGYSNFVVIIPSRSEGYGIPERAVSENPDAKVFLALDCGTLDRKPVMQACSMGADCIVIDHHELPAGNAESDSELAPASVLINPKNPDCCSTFKEFCASGLTFLFLASLRRAIRESNTTLSLPALGGKYLALAATGTVADLVPLVSANRILARSGLRNLNANACTPLSILADSAGLTGKTLTAGHIGFHLGPRINAAGRVSEGQIAYELLTACDRSDMVQLAGELDGLNGLRRAQEEKIIREIGARLGEHPPTGRTLVMGSSGWNAGVVGIAASRVQQDLYYAPVVILSIDESTGIARGSARSITGFDIHGALSLCSDLLIKWGGHKAAAGLTISADRISRFAERLEEIALQHEAGIFVPCGKVDLELPMALIGPELFNALMELEPHGMGNPAPVFALHGPLFKSVKTFGKERNHLKFDFGNGLEGIWWRGAQHYSTVAGADKKGRTASGAGRPVDMIFKAGWNGYSKRGMLEILDIGNGKIS